MVVYKVRCIKDYEKVCYGSYGDNRRAWSYIAFLEGKFYDLEIEDTVIGYTVVRKEPDIFVEAYFVDEEQMNEYFIIDIKETRKQKLNIINNI